MNTIETLLKNSGLPGPRGNLKLLYSFIHDATGEEVDRCLAYCTADLRNSPEEFVAMCGVAGYILLHRDDVPRTLETVRPFASHGSWRIREAVAIGIQEIGEDSMEAILRELKQWAEGNELERRAVVAALCEPKLLKDPAVTRQVLEMLAQITRRFEETDAPLSGNEKSLQKTLGYGWSVAIAALPEEGKRAFEGIVASGSRHVRWIVRENLGKNRLSRMDEAWVREMRSRLQGTG